MNERLQFMNAQQGQQASQVPIFTRSLKLTVMVQSQPALGLVPQVDLSLKSPGPFLPS
jgi:hypothetical protein